MYTLVLQLLYLFIMDLFDMYILQIVTHVVENYSPMYTVHVLSDVRPNYISCITLDSQEQDNMSVTWHTYL